MPTNQFLQFDEDAARLPEGFKRISYDSDTRVYTFKDRHGTLYRGEPGNEYGKLTPVGKYASAAAVEKVRPGAFASNNSRSKSDGARASTTSPTSPGSTFQDFLPSTLLTTSTLSERSPTLSLSPSSSPVKSPGATTPKAQFRDAVKKATMMQGVVHGLRRSITTLKKGAGTAGAYGHGHGHGHGYGYKEMDKEERRALVAAASQPAHYGSSTSTALHRSATSASTATTSTTRSDRTVSTLRPTKHS